MADLTELFARLKSPNVQSPSSESPQPQHQHYSHPSVSSPVFSPSPSGLRPHHESAVLSPNTSAMNTPGPEAGNDRTTSLLNLLRFNQPQQQASARQSSISLDNRPPSSAAHTLQNDSPGHSARPVSASDLVASFMKNKSSSSMAMQSPAVASPASGRAEPLHTPSTENPQDILLKLLNHPKSGAASEAGSTRHLDTNKSPASLAKSPAASIPDLTEQLSAARLDSNTQVATSTVPEFGKDDSGHSFGVGSSAAPSGSIFTYANPFDQLERSSPLKRTGKSDAQRTGLPKVDILKHERDPSSNFGDGQGAAPSPKHRKLSPEKALSNETVSKAVTELGQQVEKELEEVLAEADVKQEEKVLGDNSQAVLAKEAEKTARKAAQEIKRELKDPETREVLEAALDAPAVRALEEVAENLAPDNIADSWESADAEDSPTQAEGDVKVFNFPMRPFTSIEVVKLQDKPPAFRSTIFMDVAKLKKEFDQMDRQLVCASKNFIVYATLKPLGFRVIRQESGRYRPVFAKTEERVFNITMCTSTSGATVADSETVIGTGVNGSIFWTTVQTAYVEGVPEENLDHAGFVFPPAPVHDDNTSGGQLKTRAKTSTRHPEFFAVGRGKSIHLVYPKVARSDRYTNQTTRICDSEKYLKERSLKIVTGKAGKDFAFSADDSVIVSLDKAGKMRFWDIRSLWDASDATPTGSFEPLTIRAPLWTLQTTSPSEKSWPTSVFFLDKERPVTKGIALRYLVVGQKQNHTLQLWDLGLGKAVQELNLPHDNESDAICTVAYHAKSGVMVVGHPTRNSIYFIHISAPKYTLAAMSQAKYLTLLADPKSTLSKPESTAIMSGIREYSLGSKGKLRTFHLLDEHASAPESFAPGDAPVFELYVVHSKGVSLINIFREDLGWTKDFRVRSPVDAAGTGAVTVSTLRPPQPVTEGSTNGEPRTAPSTQGITRDASKKESVVTSRSVQTPEAAMRASTLAKVESKQEAERAAIINGSDKTEKKKKKRAADTASQVSNAPSRTQSSQPSSLPTTSTPSYAQAAQLPTSPVPPSISIATQSKSTDADVPEWAMKILSQSQQSSAPPAVDETVVKRLATNVASDVTQALTDGLTGLYKRIDDDKRALDASSSVKQEAVLRLVSSTLSDNLDQAFGRHIKEAIGTSILPALNHTVSSSLGAHVARTLQQTTAEVISREFKASLPNFMSKAMKEPDTLRVISDLVSSKVAKSVDGQVSASIKNLGPELSKIAVTAAQQVAIQMDNRFADQFRQSEAQRQTDAVKIDQLTKLVQSLTESVHSMVSAQSELKEEIVRLQRSPAGSTQGQSPTGKREVAKPEAPKGDPELEAIRQLITDGAYEDGTIMWLQSSRQPELFDLLFVRCSPAFIQHLSPLVALSVAAAATSSLESYLSERLVWLEQVLMTIDPKDGEIVEVVPQIMDVLSARLHTVYMQANEVEGTNPQILKRISSLARKSSELKREAQHYFHSIPGERG